MAAFLGVNTSIGGRSWVDRLDEEGRRRALTIAQRHGVPEILSRLLASRLADPDTTAEFLNPTIKALMPDPSTLADMDTAADRITRAVRERERVAVFGDYDVDGATSAALMHRFLREAGIEAEIYIPDRIFEGYGPNTDALEAIKARGADLLITVDCGMTAYEPLARAAEIGLETVVIDHHQPGERLPEAVAVVNPNRDDDLSGLGALAAVGVTFMAVVAANRALRHAGRPSVPMDRLMDWLPLVALGTVCDVVPLTGLNRAFVRRGLEMMAQRRIAGLRALSDVARLAGPPSAYHLGFLLGPRINAGGRIGRSDLGALLLSGDGEDEALRIAEDLDRLNRERQEMESRMLDLATAEAEAALGASRSAPFLLSASADWHPGVIGLIASRMKDRFGRPFFAVSLDRQGRGTGSARSVPGVDLGAIVRRGVAEGVLAKGGGHAMAAGFTLDPDRLADLRGYLEEAITGLFDPLAIEMLPVDGALTAGGLTAELHRLIEQAGPFGAGSPDPLFALPHHRVRSAGIVGSGHVRARLTDGSGAGVDAIAFRAAETPLGQALLKADRPLHVAGHARIDRWGGGERVQLQIRDAAWPERRQ